MKNEKTIAGFSKLSKEQKIQWIADRFLDGDTGFVAELPTFWHEDAALQKVVDGFSENTLSNFYLPYGIAPNFVINGKVYAVPMVIEESSVVAAAAASAKYWMERGGFHTQIIETEKIGQVHFTYTGAASVLEAAFDEMKKVLLRDAADLTSNMEKRGGGVRRIELRNLTAEEPQCYQLLVSFETCDSMGANFINSVLEAFAKSLEIFSHTHTAISEAGKLTIIMAILSNYTPNCLVRTWVECPIEDLGIGDGIDPVPFAEKFYKAVRIAQIDPYRATTHNKGIFNGIDAVVLATANDFRAIEACGHAYAARDGQYRSLSACSLVDGKFRFWMDLPLAVGTIGGLTKLHPLAKRSLEILGNPSAHELMSIIATVGLAQNFGAVRSLVTTGIQKGHMKMHLTNILNHLGASEVAAASATLHFEQHPVTFTAVRDFLEAAAKTIA